MRPLAVLAVAGAVLLGGSSAAPGEVRVRFSGLTGGGQVSVALFADQASWRRREGAAQSVLRPVSGGGAETVFSGVRPGRYAIMAYHDRNGDGRLNTNAVGLPQEPYGFSNDARGPFGMPPGWRGAAFEVGLEGAVQSVRLR